jgi:RNA polymerase sigma factor for flagellar operon FliA
MPTKARNPRSIDCRMARPTRSANALDESLRQAIIDAIQALPERERLVLSLYYEQELNLKEIGAVLKVTESRVCQLHGQALLRLKVAA